MIDIKVVKLDYYLKKSYVMMFEKEFGWNDVWKSWHGWKCWSGGMAEWNVWMDVALKKMLVNEWCSTKLNGIRVK